MTRVRLGGDEHLAPLGVHEMLAENGGKVPADLLN